MHSGSACGDTVELTHQRKEAREEDDDPTSPVHFSLGCLQPFMRDPETFAAAQNQRPSAFYTNQIGDIVTQYCRARSDNPDRDRMEGSGCRKTTRQYQRGLSWQRQPHTFEKNDPEQAKIAKLAQRAMLIDYL